jgi:hypothetical protein
VHFTKEGGRDGEGEGEGEGARSRARERERDLAPVWPVTRAPMAVSSLVEIGICLLPACLRWCVMICFTGRGVGGGGRGGGGGMWVQKQRV